mgnify:CR=1 FL=1
MTDINNHTNFSEFEIIQQYPNSEILTSICKSFEGQEIYYKETILLMVNKPSGVISANKDGLHETVLDLIGEPYNRFDLRIAGRLDIDTEGLILLTNDGKLLHKIISPNKDVYKKYYVEVDNPFDSKKLLRPMTILDGASHEYTPLPPRVEELTETSFYLEIKEGNKNDYDLNFRFNLPKENSEIGKRCLLAGYLFLIHRSQKHFVEQILILWR